MKISVHSIWVLPLAIFLTACFVGCKGPTDDRGGYIWFVDAGAGGAQTGRSWADAFLTVQEAVDSAGKGDRVFVKEGIYTSGTTDPVVVMKKGVKIYGGFAGAEYKLKNRGDPALHPTILDGVNTSFHVIIGASGAKLDGFIITRGNAGPAAPDDIGGGMLNVNVNNLKVKNCLFKYNSAYGGGGGMANYGSSLIVNNSVFDDNSAWLNGGAGMANFSSNSIINNSYFYYNYLRRDGLYSRRRRFSGLGG